MGTDPVFIRDIPDDLTIRIPTGIDELDEALTGGTQPGQVILLAAPPGDGKSTLMLQVAGKVTSKKAVNLNNGKQQRKKNKALYITGEEPVEQIRARAVRLNEGFDVLLVNETNINNIERIAVEYDPEYFFVDSIQGVSNNELGTMKDAMQRIYTLAHIQMCTTFVSCHVTKDGEIAGPKVLEHGADTVATFDKDSANIRVLRLQKNRMGSTERVGIFQMTEKGLISYIDPSANLRTTGRAIGRSYGVGLLGPKAIVVEVQALAVSAAHKNGSRSSLGFPRERLNMILAVLEDQGLGDYTEKDVYVSIVGGLNFEDPALDLPVALALTSAKNKKAIGDKSVFAGEIDLLGNIKQPTRSEVRHQITNKLGFKLTQYDELGDACKALT